jgi:glutamyl-tRNA synthetase
MPLFEAQGFLTNDIGWLSKVLAQLRPRCKKLPEFVDQIGPFFVEPAEYDAAAVRKHLSAPGTNEHLQALRVTWAEAERSEGRLEKALRDLADTRTVKAAVLIQGTRIALTGRMVSPGLFEMMVLLGREQVLARLDKLIKTL